MPIQLSPVETRILGCLIEKERTTPENYPLSLNALVNACNQTTNREPVVSWDEKIVERGLEDLRAKKLATMVWSSGSRVQKFRHDTLESYTLDREEMALLCVLLLRGPQTLGELRARTERMSRFANVQDVETRLAGLMQGEDPLVRLLPQRSGQKEARYAQLLSGEPEPMPTAEEPRGAGRLAETQAPPSRLDALESEVSALKAEVAALREELAGFRKQFE